MKGRKAQGTWVASRWRTLQWLQGRLRVSRAHWMRARLDGGARSSLRGNCQSQAQGRKASEVSWSQGLALSLLHFRPEEEMSHYPQNSLTGTHGGIRKGHSFQVGEGPKAAAQLRLLLNKRQAGGWGAAGPSGSSVHRPSSLVPVVFEVYPRSLQTAPGASRPSPIAEHATSALTTCCGPKFGFGWVQGRPLNRTCVGTCAEMDPMHSHSEP